MPKPFASWLVVLLRRPSSSAVPTIKPATQLVPHLDEHPPKMAEGQKLHVVHAPDHDSWVEPVLPGERLNAGFCGLASMGPHEPTNLFVRDKPARGQAVGTRLFPVDVLIVGLAVEMSSSVFKCKVGKLMREGIRWKRMVSAVVGAIR